MDKKIILVPTYLPNISFCSYLITRNFVWNINDHYQKQSFLNRTYIHSANGNLMLSVPIKHSKKNLKRKFSDIEIDNEQDWLKNHFKSIKISYQSSPYYEFYEQEINNFFKNKTKKLYDLNLKSIKLISKLLNISLSDDFIETKDNLIDLSSLSYKKKSEIKVERYHQTFEDKNGFINDLCVLDLIFNYGPNAIDYLKRQACKPDSV